MRWLKRALLALLLVAAPAQSTTYYASPTGSDANNGLSAGAPKTITWYLENVPAGSVVYLLPGTYPSNQTNGTDSESGLPVFWNQRGGTSLNRITYIGDPVTPANVRLNAGLTLSYFTDGPRFSNQYITIRGVSMNGSLRIYGKSGSSPRAMADSVVYCVIDSSFSIGLGDSCVVMNNTIGSGGYENIFSIREAADREHSFQNKVALNTMNLGLNKPTSANMIALGCADSLRFLSNTITQTLWGQGDNTASFNTYFGPCNSLFLDNSWTFKNLFTNGTDKYGLNLRDSTSFCIFARNTFRTDTTSTSPVKCEFSTSGTYSHGNRYNVFSDNIFHVNGALGYQTQALGDIHKFNQYISKHSFSIGSSTERSDSLTFRHNTFLVTDPQTIDFAVDSTNALGRLSNARVVSNIFNSNGSTQGAHVSMRWWSGAGVRDSNLVFCTTQDSANAYDRPSTDLDAHSHWADPVFVNSRWETADLTPSKKYLAKSTDLWPDTYVGAIDPGTYIPALEIYQLVLPDCKLNTYYEVRLRAVNGASPYTWSLGAGGPSLPTGLTLDSVQGIISGTPTAEGQTTVELVATDDLLATTSRVFTMNVSAGATVPPKWCHYWWCRIFGW